MTIQPTSPPVPTSAPPLAALVSWHLVDKNWTQEELRERMIDAVRPWLDDPYDYKIGLSAGKISDVKNDDQAIPNTLTLYALSKALGIPMTEVLKAVLGVEVE